MLRKLFRQLLPALGLWPALLATAQAPVGDTPAPPRRLPYTMESALAHPWGPTTRGRIADVNGDGVDELVCFLEEQGELNVFRLQGGSIIQIHQLNLGGRGSDWRRVSFHGCCDIDDDGAEELLVSFLCGDSFCLRAYGLGSGVVSEALLLCGLNAFGEEGWDGTVHAVAEHEPAAGERGLVLSVGAGFDLRPRAVVAYDGTLSDTLWSYRGGAQVRQLVPCDVNGCGLQEVVFASDAPANGASENTTDDMHSYVGLLSSGGDELWLQSLGGMFTDTHVALADLDGDGELEVVTVTSPEVDSETIESRLAVWRASDGTLIDETRVPGFTKLPHALDAAGDSPGSGRIFVVDGSNTIRAYVLADGRLREHRTVQSPARTGIDMVAGIPGTDMKGVLAHSDDGHLYVYSRDLRELARFAPPARAPYGERVEFLGQFVESSDVTRLVAISDKLYAFKLVKAALGPRMFVGVAVAIAVGALLASARTRRGLISVGVRLLPPHAGGPVDEEHRALALLSAIEMGDHDRTLVLRPLRTLQKAAALLCEDPCAGNDVVGLALRSLTNYNEFTRHALRDILLKSGAWGGAPDVRRATRSAAEAAERAVAAIERDLEAGVPSAEHVRALERHADRLENVLRELREEVSRQHVVHVGAELERAAELSEAATSGMTVEMDLSELGDAHGWVPPGEFQFIACNLISNAARATRGRATRRLRVRADAAGDVISLRFSDTGAGIPEENHEKIFDYGHSNKRSGGGGGGLYFSRKVLAGHGGSIVVEKSAPGAGATFLVTLRRAPTRSRKSGENL